MPAGKPQQMDKAAASCKKVRGHEVTTPEKIFRSDVEVISLLWTVSLGGGGSAPAGGISRFGVLRALLQELVNLR